MNSEDIEKNKGSSLDWICRERLINGRRLEGYVTNWK